MEPHFGFCVHAGALWQQRSNHTHVTFLCRSMEAHSTVLWGKQQVKNKITSKQTVSSSVAIQMKTIEGYFKSGIPYYAVQRCSKY